MTIHWAPVAESERSFCKSGTASATMVWSMNIIATAKIIATSTSRWLEAAGAVASRVPGRVERFTGEDLSRGWCKNASNNNDLLECSSRSPTNPLCEVSHGTNR